jgi:hypothetical protein
MKYLLLLLILLTALVQADYRNKALGFTDTTVPGYDAVTQPNRTGIVSVSLDLNTAIFYLADPLENPALPYDILLGSENHYCWAEGSEYRRRTFQYQGTTYRVDVVLNPDNSLSVYLDDLLIAEEIDFCEVIE